MNTIEDRIRAAAHAAADTVPPDGVPPLRLPPGQPGQSRRRSWSAWSPWAGRLAPAAAALTVVAIVISAVLIGRSTHEPTSRTPTTTSGSRAIVAGPPISSYVSSSRIPRYFVGLASHGNPNFNPSYAVVQVTASGKTLATIQPSVAHGTILATTAAADDRTFVLDEQRWGTSSTQIDQPRMFYLLRLGTTGYEETLYRLPFSVPKGELLTGFALSPDASKLAITVEPDNNSREPNLTLVSVYTLASGAVRTWTANGTIGSSGDDARSLSWTADGRTLAFDWEGTGQGASQGVWLLNLDGRGSNLLADSRQAMSTVNQAQIAGEPAPTVSVVPVTATDAPAVPSSAASSSSLSINVPTCQNDSIITPDGSAVICDAIAAVNTKVTGTGLSRGAVTEFREYSTATGKVTRILGDWTYRNVGALAANVLWSNASGSVLIGVIPDAGSGRAGVISGNTFTPLPAQVASSTAVSGAW